MFEKLGALQTKNVHSRNTGAFKNYALMKETWIGHHRAKSPGSSYLPVDVKSLPTCNKDYLSIYIPITIRPIVKSSLCEV